MRLIRPTRTSLTLHLAVFVALAATPAAHSQAHPGADSEKPSPTAVPGSDPPVIAVLEGGLNVLHKDFEFARGQRLKLPAAIPDTTTIRLPRNGTFEDRLRAAQEGPLAHLEADRLYHVAGTRLLLYVPTDEADGPAHNALQDRVHGTGVASAAVGLRHGTNPGAFLVVVLAAQPNAASWRWLTQAQWIDVISTSYNNLYTQPIPVVTCPEGRAISEIVAQGRIVFSAVGNGEQLGHVMSPSGHPDAYQVGGVDENGVSYLWGPQRSHRSTPNRPYETGDRYDFMAADPDSLDGKRAFGGTSGATPSTAGRAADLIAFARKLLNSPRRTTKPFAVAGRRAPVPRLGPMADGDLTAAELAHLLHMVARPALPEAPGRFLAEGYGALSEEAVADAKAILAGKRAQPDRATDDSFNQRIEDARRQLFPAQRCD